MAERSATDPLTCSFCGKHQREVKKLIAGPTVYICDECVLLCRDIIHESPQEDAAPLKVPPPLEIHHYLDQYVIGQEEAKRTLAVAVYNHYKRVQSKGVHDVEIEKSNVLVIGPTGTGKTLLAQSLARLLNVPFTVADATSLTEAGYVGEDVDSIIQNLFLAAEHDVAATERGIIYLDEIDKLTRRGEGPGATRDVSGEGVQQGLLKLIEGSKVSISPRGTKKYGQQEANVQIDTSNILFICGGAFVGLEEIVERRLGKKNLGFIMQGDNSSRVRKESYILHDAIPEDLVSFGFIPEFVGRLPVHVALEPLSEADLIRILTEPKNALIKQYQKLFSMEGVELHFEAAALHAVAQKALERKSGARGLRAVLESSMLDIMYEVPFLDDVESCTITKDVITKGAEPLLRRSKNRKRSA